MTLSNRTVTETDINMILDTVYESAIMKLFSAPVLGLFVATTLFSETSCQFIAEIIIVGEAIKEIARSFVGSYN